MHTGLTVLSADGATQDAAEEGGSSALMAKALQRLRQRGLARGRGDSAPQSVACQQWLRQCVEDYPDEFIEEVYAGNIPGFNNNLHEPIEDSLLMSHLWVLDLHGDPSSLNRDWQNREVWLSRRGRIWLGPKPENPQSLPTLYLGGECISNLLVLPVTHGATTRIEGEAAYVMHRLAWSTIWTFKVFCS